MRSEVAYLALGDLLHRHTTSVANGAQRKSTGSRLLLRATLATRNGHTAGVDTLPLDP